MEKVTSRTVNGVHLVVAQSENAQDIYRDVSEASNFRHVEQEPYTYAEHIERHKSAEHEGSPDNSSMVWLYRLVKRGPIYVGTVEIGVFPLENEAELGFVIFFPHRRKGYATIACALLIEEFLERYPDMPLLASCNEYNVESQRVLKKLGEPPRICRRPQLVRSRVYDKQNDEQIFC